MLSHCLRSSTIRLLPVLLAVAALLPADALQAQPMQPGEAFVTRFSGTTDGTQGEAVIDPDGTVGSIIDVRTPGQPPQGQHWLDEPQRRPLKASDVGQVFGVALDGQNPPNIYVTATPAFGLHLTSDNKQWMPGMWGPGGPGAVYKLDARTGRPSLFAQLTLQGRENTGASLGNIAYDRWNRQFFVSDLETGMIHRLRAADGADLGVWDHGGQARTNFFDVDSGQPANLTPIPFNPSSRARIDNCPGGSFSATPECWNIAPSGRRVWGLGVSRDAKTGTVRLYYSVASSPAFGNKAWNGLSDEQKRNSVWSVQLGPDGSFAGEVRREFLLPDFFEQPNDIARAGYSQPVSDITFPVCSNRGVMLLAERGGLRNLGFSEPNPFANPHEARLLRYELDHEGIWRAVGRYDVGFRERQPEDGPPTMQANCAGGAAFGYGYDNNKWTVARNQPDQFVWTTGDALCSSAGPCNAPGGDSATPAPDAKGAAAQPAADTDDQQQSGDLEVNGIQGIAESSFQPLTPVGAGPAQGSSLNESYMIDTDINVDNAGNIDAERTLSNDATWIGDIAIYQICQAAPMGFIPVAAPPPAVGIGHAPQISHSMYESHGRATSHFRFGSHSPYISHNRWQSHYRHWSHHRDGSHNRRWSHDRRGSLHNRVMTHQRHGSPHDRVLTHKRYGSPHDRALTHKRFGTTHNRLLTHKQQGSRTVEPVPKKLHTRAQSQVREIPPKITPKTGSKIDPRVVHNRAMTHAQTGSQQKFVPKGTHLAAASHARKGSVKATPKTAPQKVIRQQQNIQQKTFQQKNIQQKSFQQKGFQQRVVSPQRAGRGPRLQEGGGQKKSGVQHTQASSHQRAGSAKKK